MVSVHSICGRRMRPGFLALPTRRNPYLVNGGSAGIEACCADEQAVVVAQENSIQSACFSRDLETEFGIRRLARIEPTVRVMPRDFGRGNMKSTAGEPATPPSFADNMEVIAGKDCPSLRRVLHNRLVLPSWRS